MDENMSVGLREQIIAELTTELSGEPTFKAEILEIKVNDAYRKVKARKAYHNTSFDDEKIEKHLYDNHYQDIKDVALYNYNMIGAEFQKSHKISVIIYICCRILKIFNISFSHHLL